MSTARPEQTKPQNHWHYLIWIMVVLTLLISLLITKRVEWLDYFSSRLEEANKGVQIITPQEKELPVSATLSLELSDSAATVSGITAGTEYDARIMLDTLGQPVVGADANLTFDPQMIKIIRVDKGTFFNTYPTASFSDEKGKILLSGLSSAGKTYTGQGVFGMITFRPLVAGQTEIDFVFSPGGTRDSNVVSPAGEDRLGLVQNLSLTIGE